MELLKCRRCGEEWPEGGEVECPFCGYDDLDLIDEEDEAKGEGSATGK